METSEKPSVDSTPPLSLIASPVLVTITEAQAQAEGRVCVRRDVNAAVDANANADININNILHQKEEPRRDDLLPALLESIQDNEWKQVLYFLEKDPLLSRRQVSMVCQGENSKCLLVHMLCGRRTTPIPVIDMLVTLHPASLLQAEERGGRLPIHLAVVKDASFEVAHYICQARPQALRKQDQEGNHPVHYAAMYGSSAVLRLLVQLDPAACGVSNGRDRFPLHILCARYFETDVDTDTLSPKDMDLVVDAYPDALRTCDRFGRTPLHLAAHAQQPQWELLEILIRRYPQALVLKDKAGKTPLTLAKGNIKFGNQSKSFDLVVSSLVECTLRERRKQSPYTYLPSFLLNTSSISKRKQRKNDLYHCYG
jgi:ankyrin repeat protein